MYLFVFPPHLQLDMPNPSKRRNNASNVFLDLMADGDSSDSSSDDFENEADHVGEKFDPDDGDDDGDDDVRRDEGWMLFASPCR